MARTAISTKEIKETLEGNLSNVTTILPVIRDVFYPWWDAQNNAQMAKENARQRLQRASLL